MWIAVLFIIILLIGLKYKNKLNDMFNQPTAEEFEAYQESVFLHIEDEIDNYKKDINNIFTEKAEPLKDEIQCMLSELNEKLSEYSALEKRLDEKIIKLNNYNNLIK